MLLLLIISIISSYTLGLLTDKYRGTKKSKFFTVAAVTVTVGILFFYKYADFFISNTNLLLKPLFSVEIPLLKFALPLGISFYSFQIISYNVDLYRGVVPVQKNFINLALYISLFPQLIAGPIVRYKTVENQLSKRKHTLENFSVGTRRFVFGLAKKVLIANILYEICNGFSTAEKHSFVFCWLYAIVFTLYVYFDFSGYSSMAIGLGKMFGFSFEENFNYPFISKSVKEFWQRWHISLGTWFRDYVYIPLGGNKVSVSRWILNIVIVWGLTGFWHGADWNFIIWGIYFGILLILEKLFIGKILGKIPQIFSHIYLIITVVIGFIIFNASGIFGLITDLGGLFGIGVTDFIDATTVYYLKNYGVVIIAAIIFSTPIVKIIADKICRYKIMSRVCKIASPLFTMILLIVVTAYLVDGSFNPFLYFRF